MVFLLWRTFYIRPRSGWDLNQRDEKSAPLCVSMEDSRRGSPSASCLFLAHRGYLTFSARSWMQQQQDEMNELRDPVKRTASCCPSSSSSSSFLTAHATGGCHCGQAKTSTKKAYLCTGYLQLPATLHQFPALFQILDRVWQLVGTGSGKRLCGSGCHITVKPKVYFVFFFFTHIQPFKVYTDKKDSFLSNFCSFSLQKYLHS